MYCAVGHMCVKIIFDPIRVHFSHSCSFLPIKCVHKCADDLHKISCNSYYILITQQRPERGASKYFRIGATAPRVFNSKYLCCFPYKLSYC